MTNLFKYINIYFYIQTYKENIMQNIVPMGIHISENNENDFVDAMSKIFYDECIEHNSYPSYLKFHEKYKFNIKFVYDVHLFHKEDKKQNFMTHYQNCSNRKS
jgi:hypothetical protein